MLDDSKLGTVLAAAAAVFIVFFLIFLLLFGWGFYISSALGAVGAVTIIWWMGIEDAATLEDEAGQGRVTSRPITPAPAPATEEIAAETPLEDDTFEDVERDDLVDPAPLETATDPIKGDAPEAEEPEDLPIVGTKPTLMAAPEGDPDDLTKIKGIGPKLSDMLNGMGVWHFHQIAGWSDAELDWVDDNLEGFKGRARRDDWVGQAKDLA